MEKIEVSELSYDQRKALRRIGRGQSIPRRMHEDEVIQKCFYYDTEPLPEIYDIVEYTDWYYRAVNAKPVITEIGKKLLDELERN